MQRSPGKGICQIKAFTLPNLNKVDDVAATQNCKQQSPLARCRPGLEGLSTSLSTSQIPHAFLLYP